jgi:serine/threonine protein kinase/Tol biopolymer transport system component
MTLQLGTRVGSYHILSGLGAGGMGEVYRARDTKLNRDVALKVLPELFAADPDRLARFKREAQVLASLNHPHIAAIYGFEDSGATHALVLELVEGPTLADRITEGSISLGEALPIAKQIAEALEAAHEHGVIHRDLKPANIKLRPDGTVKVLDFGLAKAMEPASGARADFTRSPTITTPAMTGVGTILGTAAYMSPEQARGRPVDRRTDVWAFGCVLFEMLTGQRPFDGEDTTAVLARIIEREPDWRALPSGTPSTIRALLTRCLRKDPAHRLRDIADGRFQLEDATSDPAGPATVAPRTRGHREWLGWGTAILLLGTTAFLAVRPNSPASSREVISFPVFPPEKTAFAAALNTTVNIPSFALSPDGRDLVFSVKAPGARPMLWVRSLDRIDLRQLDATEDAQDPMWSPDGRWIGFFANGQLKKIPAAGGAVQLVAQSIADVRGGSWGADDFILIGGGTNPIVRVNAAGGTPTPVNPLDASRHESTHRTPFVLPGSRDFLYTIISGQPDQSGVYAGSLDGKTKKPLIRLNTSAVYAPPGYLLFVDGDALLAQAFDADRLEVAGQPFLVANHVGRSSAFVSAVSASRTETIAYGGPISQAGRLIWLDRTGRSLGSAATPEADYVDFRLSPDDTRLAASIVDPRTNVVEMWLTDLARSSSTRIAAGGLVTASPLWSPDGTQLIFRNTRNGVSEFYQRSAAGGGDDRPVLAIDAYRALTPGQNLIDTDWSPDGRTLLFSVPAPASGNDLWLLPLGSPEKAAKFITTPGEDLHGNFSPDGRLVAYTSNESGRFEVYVQTVPRSDRKWAVSTGGGYEPRWRADGREIYYLSEDRKLMAVSVGAGPSFGIPQPLFQTRVPEGVIANRTHYVSSRDGQKFLVNTATDAPPEPITVVVNWTAALKK